MKTLREEIFDLLQGEEVEDQNEIRSEARRDSVEVVRVPTEYVGTHYAAGATFARAAGNPFVSVTIDGKGTMAFDTVRKAVDHYVEEEF